MATETDETQRTVDGLENVATGLGSKNDKSIYRKWTMPFLANNYIELESCYLGNWIATKIVDLPAEDSCAGWRVIKSSRAEDIARHELEIGYRHTVQEALQWSLLYGGAGILMLTGQDLEKPFNPAKVKKGVLESSIGGLRAFDRYDLSGQEFNIYDVLAPNYMEPTYYVLRGGTTRIHYSHVVRFKGKNLPKRYIQHTEGWGDSYLRRVLEDISDIVEAQGGVASLMKEANVDVFRAEGLFKQLSTNQDSAIINRYQLLNILKSSMQAIVLDKNEEYDRKTLQLSGVADVIDNFMTWISGASGIPTTKLFGTAAKGLGATGEGDMRNYYDMLHGIQNNTISPALRTLDEVLCRSAIGSYPNDFDYQWNPLEKENQLQRAQIRKLDSERHISYIDSGVVNPAQVQRELQANEVYQFDDDAIEKVEQHYNDPLALLDKEPVSEAEQSSYESDLKDYEPKP